MPSSPGRSVIAGLLLLAGCDRPEPAPVQANAASADEAVSDAAPAPPATAAAAKVDRSHKGEAAPVVAFERPDGARATLADFRGKPVLLNLWATWCAPCVAEMPTLDAAAKALGDTATVLAVSQDLDPAKAEPFFARTRLAALQPYRDPQMALSLAYQANLPTTILLDARGHEVWRLTGTRDWADTASRALIAEAG